MGMYIEGLDKQVQKGAESITVTFWDKDELIINEYDIGDMSKVTDLDLVRCGECEYADEYNHCKYSAWWNGNADFCSHGIRRKESR